MPLPALCQKGTVKTRELKTLAQGHTGGQCTDMQSGVLSEIRYCSVLVMLTQPAHDLGGNYYEPKNVAKGSATQNTPRNPVLVPAGTETWPVELSCLSPAAPPVVASGKAPKSGLKGSAERPTHQEGGLPRGPRDCSPAPQLPSSVASGKSLSLSDPQRLHCRWECKMVQPRTWQFLTKRNSVTL